MYCQVSAVACAPSQNAAAGASRRSANYHPSIWGDHFLKYASEFRDTDENLKQHIQELKDKVRMMLITPDEKPIQKLELIDAIQRLGISYHFETEIEEILQQLHETLHDHDDLESNNDLYMVALQFRLLRQEGYYISCDKFTKFMENHGKFKESLANDVRGMLSLYEATHLRIHGEDILEEALVLTRTQLKAITSHLSAPFVAQVTQALKQPIRKGIPRLEARHFISIYEEDASHNNILLTFAKLDFNLLQNLHQKELSDITRWWKDLDVPVKLPFARDRIVECYFWILAIYFEPQYLLARSILTKVIAMTSIMDDIYDVYGTFEELELFTDAIERWDIGVIDQLPKYMEVCYRKILEIYYEMEKVVGEGRLYCIKYAREAMINQVRAYFHEAKWLHQKYIPTFDEYMGVAIISCAYHLLATTSLVGMGDIITEDSFKWLLSNPKVLRASSVICRLMDDMMSDKIERKREHIPSAIECYMMQHGVTEEKARQELQKQVTDAWKDMNEECLCPTAVSMSVIMRVFNLARVIDVFYKDDDGYSNAQVQLKDFITILFVDPVPF